MTSGFVWPNKRSSVKKLALTILLSLLCFPLRAQESNPFAPAESLQDGWEQIDQRLIFLMIRLVDVEANLEAIEKSIGKTTARKSVATGQANRAEAGNNRMDQRAGGPVRWDQFYGRTAEKFFYHPTENHTYHTSTILTQRSPSSDNQVQPGVPSRQGLPVHQRPPQFDYMYRANQSAQRRAEARIAELRGNQVALSKRRKELELEQCQLWIQVAFRAVARNDLDRKTLYRFEPKKDGLEHLTDATRFIRTALALVEHSEAHQASVFREMRSIVSKAREDLANSWTQDGVAFTDEASNEWKFAVLARYLEDIASNLTDSYQASVDSAANHDDERRNLYRGLLQKSLVQYAEGVLALDEMATEMAEDLGFSPSLEKPFEKITWVNIGTSGTQSQGSVEPRIESVDLLSLIEPERDFLDSRLKLVNGKLLTPAFEARNATLVFPYKPVPKEYDLNILLERLGNRRYGCSFGIVMGGKQAVVDMDGSMPSAWCLSRIDGYSIHDHQNPTLRHGKRLPIGQARNVTIQVRSESVTVLIDGERLFLWSGKPSQLTVWDQIELPDSQALFMFSQAEFAVHEVSLQVIAE